MRDLESAPLWKRRVLAGALAAALAWPAVQHVLVTRNDANPWVLAGLAMYSVPHRLLDLRVSSLVDGHLRPIPREAMTPALQDSVRAYARAHSALGWLASPDALLAQLFAAAPDANRVALIVTHLQLELDSARLRERRAAHAFTRDGARERLDVALPPLADRS